MISTIKYVSFTIPRKIRHIICPPTSFFIPTAALQTHNITGRKLVLPPPRYDKRIILDKLNQSRVENAYKVQHYGIWTVRIMKNFIRMTVILYQLLGTVKKLFKIIT